MKSDRIALSTLQVTLVVFLIKILGVVKQSILASVCGATLETDAYFMVSGIVINLSAVIFSALAISLLSMHTERLIREGRDASNNLIGAVLRVFVPGAMILSLILMLVASPAARLLAPTYDAQQQEVVAAYIRFMLPMFPLMCYYMIVNVVVETDKRFLPGKGQGLFQNLFIVLAALLFYRTMGVKALLTAFLLAGIVQCIQITISARELFRFRLHRSTERTALRQLLRLVIPLLVGNAIYEINDIVDKQIASTLAQGSVSCLSYGASVNEIVTTLIVSSVTTVLFSHFATWAAQGETDKIGANLKLTLEALLLLIMPVMIVCLTCGDSIVRVLFGRGSFSEQAATMTTTVVMGYGVGFFFQAARANIVKVCYAFQDTRTPMVNGAVSVLVNICLSFLLSRFLGVAGIALATSIAMLLATALLFPKLKKYLPGLSFRNTIPDCGKILLAALVSGAWAILLRSAVQVPAFVRLLAVGGSTLLIYLLLAMVLKVSCLIGMVQKLGLLRSKHTN